MSEVALQTLLDQLAPLRASISSFQLLLQQQKHSLEQQQNTLDLLQQQLEAIEIRARSKAEPRPTPQPEPPTQLPPIQPPAIKPPLPKRPSPPRNPYIIGLDYGTYATKILIRRRNERTCKIPALVGMVEDYSPFTVPSLVRLSERRALYFGKRALEGSFGLVRHLKGHLLKPSFGDQTLPTDEEDATVLATAYLTWVLQLLKKKLVGQEAHLPPLLHVAAPMNHLEDRQLKLKYARILNAVYETVFGDHPFTVAQGVAYSLTKEHFQRRLTAKLPDEGERRFHISPETIAPLVSLSLDPKVQPGIFMVVDLGGGTSEVSVNEFLFNGDDEKVVNCYADHSYFFGSENLPDNTDSFELLKGAVSKTWSEGYQKNLDSRVQTEKFKNLRIFVVGGGGADPESRDFFLANPPHIFQTIRNSLDVSNGCIPFGMMNDLEAQSQSLTPPAREGFLRQFRKDAGLFLVAHGLSHWHTEWPKFHFPEEYQTAQTPVRNGSSPGGRWYHE